MTTIRAAFGLVVLTAATLVTGPAGAHPEGHDDEHLSNPFAARRAAAAATAPVRLVSARRAPDMDIAAAFAPFVATGAVATRRDDRFFFVESDGVPDHPLMVGIRTWQQQVPLPQPYTGDNAWQIPLHPVPAKTPASTRNRFLRGAIAVAVNGIPIFNPLNNRGEDAKAIGELDDFGGHCGRADDYHYHVAPVHLEKVVGKGKPVAWALDGYPVFGLTEPDGSPVKPLDACHGHDDPVIGYHYHAAETYPYLIGAFHGEVTERDGQVDPQPRARGVREALPPLRGAEIVGFEFTSPTARKLTYRIAGRTGTVEYVLGADGAVSFRYTDPDGRVKTEDARPRGRGPGQGPPRDGDRPPARGQGGRRGGEGPGGQPPARGDRPPPREGRQQPPPPPPPPRDPAGGSARTGAAAALVVSCPAVGADGRLPVEFTCDGAKVSPPVQWSAGPPGTRSYAVTLWHEAPDRVKSYWVVHGIPATVHALPRDSRAIGALGRNDKRQSGYDPPCSQGPGPKTYHLTVYALSAVPQLADGGTRDDLLAAITDITLASGTLDVVAQREGR
ncbi:MAG: YbhB/YbcL family Raf kinase inhibitor-like protein [Planctomycetes bacterium]|nr:YbhB/YbcL family Raf kinase inhibitor-like protein [Planctomycetota bacterium]